MRSGDRLRRAERQLGILTATATAAAAGVPRPRLVFHEMLDVESRTWRLLRRIVIERDQAGDGGEWPHFTAATVAALQEDLALLREFDAWDSVSTDRIDARAELLALCTGAAEGWSAERVRDLAQRSFTRRPAWESSVFSTERERELVKQQMTREDRAPACLKMDDQELESSTTDELRRRYVVLGSRGDLWTREARGIRDELEWRAAIGRIDDAIEGALQP